MIELTFLKHHGTKGMRWGVKNGPPYPIRPDHDTHISKGVTFKRLTVRDETGSQEGHAYVNYRNDDAQHYTSFFSTRLMANHPGKKSQSDYT